MTIHNSEGNQHSFSTTMQRSAPYTLLSFRHILFPELIMKDAISGSGHLNHHSGNQSLTEVATPLSLFLPSVQPSVQRSHAAVPPLSHVRLVELLNEAIALIEDTTFVHLGEHEDNPSSSSFLPNFHRGVHHNHHHHHPYFPNGSGGGAPDQ